MTEVNRDASIRPDAGVHQAVILAGGQATRMRPYTDDAPKAMVPVGGVPIIAHQLLWLADNGIKHVVVSAGYKSEVIKTYLGDGSRFGLEATYAVEDEPLGRGGGLKFAARTLPHRATPFLALNGDVITHFPLAHLTQQHARWSGIATVALAPYKSNWGVADLDGDLIRGFTQSPILPYWINAGIYVFSSAIADLLPDKGDHEDTTFPELAKLGRLAGFRIDGYWRGIDTVKDVKESSAELRELGYSPPVEFRIGEPT
jgi:NDP-sugar pyrophosphorylase family protein